MCLCAHSCEAQKRRKEEGNRECVCECVSEREQKEKSSVNVNRCVINETIISFFKDGQTPL